MHAGAFDWILETLLSPPAPPTPAGTLFLMHQYARAGRDDVRETLAQWLGAAIEEVAQEGDPRRRCEWLGVLAKSAAFTDDVRISATVERLIGTVVDQLERLVRRAYEPGEGLLETGAGDQLRTAAALLTAFELTGRLPYPMLAEELLQFVRRRDWDALSGKLRGDFAANCVMAALNCRIAALHLEPDYIAAAVVAVEPSYDADARQILDWAARVFRSEPAAAAEYGAALIEWVALRDHPALQS